MTSISRNQLTGMWLLPLLMSCSAATSEEVAKTHDAVITAADARKDIYELSASSPVVRNADGVAIMTRASLLSAHDGVVDLTTYSLQLAYNTCSSVRYAAQPVLSGGQCTAYLVAPRLVATANHCTNYASAGADASQFSFVFGWRMNDAASFPQSVPAADVYHGVRVTGVCDNADCNLIELDRPVTNHVILQTRRSGLPPVGDSIYMLGHPYTLPLKFDGPAPIGTVSPLNITTTGFDVIGGFSGSPVFNATSNVVEGTLFARVSTSGVDDLDLTPEGCKIEHVITPADNYNAFAVPFSAFGALAPVYCAADANGWQACGTGGCGVCAQQLDTARYDLYLRNHPNCLVDTTCSASFSHCSEACPAPTAADSSNPAPSVSITAPANDSTLSTPASFTITVDASDVNGTVTSVSFYVGSTMIGTDTTAPYEMPVLVGTPGRYTLTARATDNGGATTISAPVNVNIASPIAGPCTGLCTIPTAFAGPNYQSGNVGTAAACWETRATLHGGNCSNLQGRTMSVNGTPVNCNNWTLPPARNGGYCVQIDAGSPSWSSFATW